MVSGNYELVSVRADELDVPERRNKNELQTWINELDEEKLHCIGAFAASKGSCLPTNIHCRVAGCHRLPFCNGGLLEFFLISSRNVEVDRFHVNILRFFSCPSISWLLTYLLTVLDLEHSQPN